MEGWVSLHRQIMNHWTYEEKRTFSRFEAWIDLILSANHKDTRFPLGNELVEAKRGEVVTSELKLMERWGWSKTKLRNFLELAEKDGMIVKKTDRKKTTILLVNYDDYQKSETTERPQGDHEETARRPREDTINNDNNDLILSTSSTTETPQTIGDANQKIFGTLMMSGMLQGFVVKYKNKGFTDTFIIEVLMEAAQTCNSGKPSIKYIESIAERWERENIYSRYQNEQQKQRAGETNEQPRGRTQTVTPFRNHRKSEALFPDDELDELNRESAAMFNLR